MIAPIRRQEELETFARRAHTTVGTCHGHGLPTAAVVDIVYGFKPHDSAATSCKTYATELRNERIAITRGKNKARTNNDEKTKKDERDVGTVESGRVRRGAPSVALGKQSPDYSLLDSSRSRGPAGPLCHACVGARGGPRLVFINRGPNKGQAAPSSFGRGWHRPVCNSLVRAFRGREFFLMAVSLATSILPPSATFRSHRDAGSAFFRFAQLRSW